ncbi:MAG: hypothetical protein E7641_02675 [Ruminococcaceae bacterium]|nr:hypothetical protein [Oscillospiraceae bacterium]
MKGKFKNILWGIFAIALVVVIVVWFALSPNIDHIEDTNGPTDHSLQQITKQDVINQKLGTKGTVSQSELHFDFGSVSVSDGVKYSSDKFTGVYRLHTATIFKGSDIHVFLGDFKINGGNFAFYVIFDGEIVGQVEPTDVGFPEFILENVDKTATLEYVIAGESASFEFVVPIDFES